MVPYSFLKGAQSIFSFIFHNFWRFGNHKEALSNHGKLNFSTEVFHLENVKENLNGYGNHDLAYTVKYRQLQYSELLHTTNGLTVSTKYLN